MASRVEVVSWDVDGTLYDLPTLKGQVARAALLRAWAPSTWRDMRVLGRFRRGVEALRARGGAIDDAWRAQRAACVALEARWYAPALARSGPRPGLRALLEALRAGGVRLVVLSDFDAEEKLARLGVEGLFEAVFSGEALGHLKPAPRLFEEVARRVGAHPASIVHVGDRADTDGAGAHAAGFRFVLADRRLPTAAEILAAGA